MSTLIETNHSNNFINSHKFIDINHIDLISDILNIISSCDNNYVKLKQFIQKYNLIQEGEKIKFTYLKVPNPFKDTVISYPSRLPPEFGLQEYIDYDMQFDKAFLEPIKVILDCMKWKVEEISSPEDFFN